MPSKERMTRIKQRKLVGCLVKMFALRKNAHRHSKKTVRTKPKPMPARKMVAR